MNGLFYTHIEKKEINREIISKLEEFSTNKGEQIYIVNKPLGDGKYSYDYEEKALVLLRPKHKIIFFNLAEENNEFEEYYDEFIEDIGSISDKFSYKNHIGRPRKWKDELTTKINLKNENRDIMEILDDYKISDINYQRKCELVISLLIGSINDIDQIGSEEPETLLDKIKKKIILFDGEQTRFIYKEIENKNVNIQGLSGTGKTELLLHKLKEIYTTTNDKIFLTCHNKILAKSIKVRIPKFFNFMKVEKQIEWDTRLWVGYGWGSQADKNSGIYSYICNFYNLEFLRYSKHNMSFEKACKILLDDIKELKRSSKEKFNYAFDYILIDESQDFPKSFFEVCDLVTSKKVYIAGDIFQDIFEDSFQDRIVNADFILNRCYRTEPRTLMFAQALGMGLFEETKFNWLTDEEWKGSGYIINRDKNNVFLSREPVRRFEDLETKNISSVKIAQIKRMDQITGVIKKIKTDNPTVQPDDIAIIYLDTDNYIYNSADNLEYEIYKEFGWRVNKGYESKEKIENTIFISNKNNVKGLEFPFVICITKKLQNNLNYRNTLYTMITRSFIQTYLLMEMEDEVEILNKALEIINQKNYIKTTQPTTDEIEKIKRTIIKQKEESIPYSEFLNGIFKELEIKRINWEKLKQAIELTSIKKFDREKTIAYIESNKEYY